MNLKSLNTHPVGMVGLYAGGASILAAVTGMFKLLTNPDYLVALYGASIRVSQHTATMVDQRAIAQLVAAFIAIVGGFALSVVAAYFGKPKTVPNQP